MAGSDVPQLPTEPDAGDEAPTLRRKATISLTLDGEVIAKLREEAKLRGTKPTTLAAAVMTAIVNDRSYIAVLDR